jgi:NitT/TauT family transport system permease protein
LAIERSKYPEATEDAVQEVSERLRRDGAKAASKRWYASSRYRLYPVFTVIFVLLVWEVVVVVAEIGVWLMPRPSEVIAATFTKRALLLPAALVTTQEIIIGFIVSVVVGLLVAMAIVSHRAVEESAYPLLIATQVIPKIAIAPILTIWFGFGMPPKVMMVFLISFFPIVIDSIVGLKSVGLGKLRLARSMGASELQMFMKIRLPNALPNILGGMKVASTFAVVGAIVGEFIGADQGLGRVILIANGNFDTVLVFAAIAYLTVIGVALFLAVDLLERLLIPWHVSRRIEHSTGRATL